MYGFEPIPAAAGGDIYPNTFVKASGAADNTILAAGSNVMVVGACAENTRDAPIDGASSKAAESGDPVTYNPEGNRCKVQVGTGGVTRGSLVKSDASGYAVLAATTGPTLQWIAGVAEESASEGELATILIKVFPHYPALS